MTPTDRLAHALPADPDDDGPIGARQDDRSPQGTRSVGSYRTEARG